MKVNEINLQETISDFFFFIIFCELVLLSVCQMTHADWLLNDQDPVILLLGIRTFMSDW